MEIDFRKTGLSGQLSNLQRREFTFRGVEVLGVESVLVAAKFSDPTEQLFVATTLHGFAAMKYGKQQPWWDTQQLHWQSDVMDRMGESYTMFLTELYDDLFEQSAEATAALLATGNVQLKHSIGGTDPTRTVLTRGEFCNLLMQKRSKLQSQRFVDW